VLLLNKKYKSEVYISLSTQSGNFWIQYSTQLFVLLVFNDIYLDGGLHLKLFGTPFPYY